VYLGLDLSTSICGYTILDQYGSIIVMSHIDLTKVKGELWDKVDVMKKEIKKLKETYPIEHVFIEEPLSKFRRGKSNAHTIGLLMRFNGIVSYLIHQELGLTPEYYPVSHARKLCGVILLPKKKSKGKDHKQQTFEQMAKRDHFVGHVWPQKRTGKLKDYCYDEMDSFVVAFAGYKEKQ